MTSISKRKSSSPSSSLPQLPSTPPQSPPSSPSPPLSPSNSTPSSPPTVSPFIAKLYSIVSNPSTQSIIHWADHGLSFLVSNEYQFAAVVMKQHFRHSNFSSFVRQLNFYGFHKRGTQGGSTQFDHEHFRRGREDLLPLIVRKSGGTGGGGGEKGVVKGEKGGENYRDDIKELGEQVRQLKSQYEDLAKMQQRILFVFGRYMSATAGGEIAGSRKRCVSSGEEGRESEGARSAAKKARLLIENRESSEESARSTNGTSQRTHKSRKRSIPNPLADIDWSDAHAMQNLLHSPLLPGAPQILNNTPIPIELPPLEARSPPVVGTRSPRPLLLTEGESSKSTTGRSLNLPPIDVGQRQTRRPITGVFYEDGDSPSSHSSTSTETGESDRAASHVPLPLSDFGLPSMGTPQSDDIFHRSYSALAWNGVIYAPPANGMDADGGGWGMEAGPVKLENEFESFSPPPFSYPPLSSSPPPLPRDPVPLLPDLDSSSVHTAPASSTSLPLSPLPADNRPTSNSSAYCYSSLPLLPPPHSF